MYHGRFNGTHYEAGFKWGRLLLKHGKKIDHSLTFELTEEKYDFARKCVAEYQEYFSEVLEEILGIADGNEVPLETLHTILFCMYCFELRHRCTCFAFSTEEETVFA